MRYKNIIMAAVMTITSLGAMSQEVTYIHDDTKMNQFLMQENGSGHFVGTSEWYYDIYHHSYKKGITSTNKSLYRTACYEASYQQVDYADSIRKRLESRAKAEAVNMADRQIDLAWVTEQSKLEGILGKYNTNVSMLRVYGATEEEKEDWEQYSKMYDFAIDKARHAYMANSERQKTFLDIYDDIVKRNMKLIKRVRYLKALSKSQQVLNASGTPQRRVAQCATAAYNKWRDNATTAMSH